MHSVAVTIFCLLTYYYVQQYTLSTFITIFTPVYVKISL